MSRSALQGENCITKLFVHADDVQIKIEVTPVLRGCVYEPAVKRVSPKVEEQFGFAEMPLVHFADLYAGKITAALDRQHPRDQRVHDERPHEVRPEGVRVVERIPAGDHAVRLDGRRAW